jgi:ABC-type cobalamin transport system permease subunit
MSWFLYMACVLTGVLSGGALGMVVGVMVGAPLKQVEAGKWVGAALGAIILTWYLLKLGRKIQKMMNEK